jgi:hypothetical protein
MPVRLPELMKAVVGLRLVTLFTFLTFIARTDAFREWRDVVTGNSIVAKLIDKRGPRISWRFSYWTRRLGAIIGSM